MPNKNRLIEMNRQLQKIETPLNQTTQPNTQPNNTEQTLTQEQKVNFKNLKRFMNGEKTTLPSLRNIEWRTVKMETEKINQVITYI